ncbi:MAG: hypothetical protein ACU0CO_00575 [Shimia sp.]
MNRYVLMAAAVIALALGTYFLVSGTGPLANQGPDVLGDPTPVTPTPDAEPAVQSGRNENPPEAPADPPGPAD